MGNLRAIVISNPMARGLFRERVLNCTPVFDLDLFTGLLTVFFVYFCNSVGISSSINVKLS